MSQRLVIPCLRGYMGSWITYSCMMRLSDASELIGFADELHQIDKLSDKIQRELNTDRAEEISRYLTNNDDRFFNSLVVAVYDGDPNWHEIGDITPNNQEAESLEFPDYAANCLGFLSITRDEKFFALDGQHRLAGIKAAIKEKEEISSDLISVIIVAHSNTPEGKVRSRRLFTTLNKKAKLVSKDTIIALDEDDISACITRQLIESDEFDYFDEENVSFSSGPVRDKTSITSIVNIYDNVQKLVAYKLGVKVSELDKYRYRDHSELMDFVHAFFSLTFDSCPELKKVIKGNEPAGFYRNSETGGHLLFRPVGWDLYTDIVIFSMLNGRRTLDETIEGIFRHSLNLSGDLLSNKVWSKKTNKILKISAKNVKALQKSLLS
ncbi:DGQHR domain-containing protein [Enterobacter cloacae complex sp. 2022EL-00788]|uniref:DGQHR domain-containing protein n=1 Tax=Enterobacter cloacae complex sp. 2022EL-00788 TaxID=2996512 RepID=UPI0022712251|nr:DNA sulfur modification protein DndB [Enterobacter cloacae complex sp. 2022EL-00788]MCY0771275.1 DGQHR domain-containing protein [Enterobacter cloacae complex sp. 2022EL-00788]